MPTTKKALKISLGFALLICQQLAAAPAQPRECVGSISLGRFRFLVQPAPKTRARPLAAVNRLQKGQRLLYIPIRLRSSEEDRASITLVLVPARNGPEQELVVLDPRSAAAATQWEVPFDVEVVGVVLGLHGLDIKKVNTLVKHDQDLITQLADYAQQTAQVGALVETLAAWEQSASNVQPLDAVLQGFSSQHNLALPRLNPKAPVDQQAALLLRTLLPSLRAYDPLNPQPAHTMQQSAGLAASVATMFLGSPAVVATGGAALFQNLRTLMSPGTEFRSAFSHKVSSDDLNLCSQSRPAKPRARVAYLWALRIPSLQPPQVAIPDNPHLPAGQEASLPLVAEDASHLRRLSRAHDWNLVPVEGGRRFGVQVSPGPSLEWLKLDMSEDPPPPGEYGLAASWDWQPLELSGRFRIHPLGDLSLARLSPGSKDRLVSGSGPVSLEFTGTDFQFVEKLEFVDAGSRQPPGLDVPFQLAKREQTGQQTRLTFELNTAELAPGLYRLVFRQAGGSQHTVPLDIHPPLPEIRNLPLRANVGEETQMLPLEGSGLERIGQITSVKATWELTPVLPGQAHLKQRSVKVYLENTAKQGELLPLKLKVQGLEAPITLEGAVKVVGPRPRIPGAEISFPAQVGLGLRQGEIPAGLPVSFAISVQHLDSSAWLDLGCARGEGFQPKLTLRPGQRQGTTGLDLTGKETLFLSVDPDSLNTSECSLTVVVTNKTTGASDPYSLGRVVRLPRIESFVLTNEKLGESLYEGILTGEELHHIAKTGWNQRDGLPVEGIPTPSLEEPRKQTLKIALPWPSPEPHAPVFIWLRGEDQGRATQVRY